MTKLKVLSWILMILRKNRQKNCWHNNYWKIKIKISKTMCFAFCMKFRLLVVNLLSNLLQNRWPTCIRNKYNYTTFSVIFHIFFTVYWWLWNKKETNKTKIEPKCHFVNYDTSCVHTWRYVELYLPCQCQWLETDDNDIAHHPLWARKETMHLLHLAD